MLFPPPSAVHIQLWIHKHTIWKDWTNSHFRCQASSKSRIKVRHFIWGWLITPLSVTVPPVPFFDGSEIGHCWRPNTGLCIPQVWFITMEIQCSHCGHLASGLGCFPTPLLLATVSCGEHPQHKLTLSPFTLFAKTQYLIIAFTHNWDNNATFDCFAKPCRGQGCCCSPVHCPPQSACLVQKRLFFLGDGFVSWGSSFDCGNWLT